MSLQLISPFDHDPDTAVHTTLSEEAPAIPPDTQPDAAPGLPPKVQLDRQGGFPVASRSTRLRQIFADLCFILVKAGAFLGAIYLAVLGLPLLLLLLLTGGDMTLLFAQLGNLSAHYLAADHAGQAVFANELKLAGLALATLTVIWRLPRFLDDVAAPRSVEAIEL